MVLGSRRSLITCNLVFSNYVFYARILKEIAVDILHTDFNKLFDSVGHNALVSVLKVTSLGEPPLSWDQSYISGRFQWVRCFGIKFNIFIAFSGVPQERHLSVLLFFLYINSIRSSLLHLPLIQLC